MSHNRLTTLGQAASDFVSPGNLLTLASAATVVGTLVVLLALIAYLTGKLS